MSIKRWVEARRRAGFERSMRCLPVLRRVLPTLRGLKLEKPKNDGLPTLVPWANVSSTHGKSYAYVTQNGEQFRNFAGRRVVLTLSDPYHQAIAKNAMRRWTRGQLQNESLRFVENLPDLRWAGLFLVADGLAL